MVSAGIPRKRQCDDECLSQAGHCPSRKLFTPLFTLAGSELNMARHRLRRALEVDQSCFNPNEAMLSNLRRMLT